LQDAPPPRAPSRITADQRCPIETSAYEKPEKLGMLITQWTGFEITDDLKQFTD